MRKPSRLIARPRKRGSRIWLWLSLVAAGLASVAAVVVAAVIATGAAVAIGLNVAATFLTDLPPVDEIATVGGQLFQTTTIHDRRGRPLGVEH